MKRMQTKNVRTRRNKHLEVYQKSELPPLKAAIFMSFYRRKIYDTSVPDGRL